MSWHTPDSFVAQLEMHWEIAKKRAQAHPLDRGAAGEVVRLERDIAKAKAKLAEAGGGP
jgi:hypothetical protein